MTDPRNEPRTEAGRAYAARLIERGVGPKWAGEAGVRESIAAIEQEARRQALEEAARGLRNADLTPDEQDVFVEAMDYAYGYRAYRYSAIDAMLGMLAEGGFVVVRSAILSETEG